MNSSEYEELLRKRPFGWEFDDPPTRDSYSFERIDPFYWHKWVEDNWMLSYYAGTIYLVTIFGIQRYLKDRPGFQLKAPLFIWNALLGIFSIVGFVRTAPEFFQLFVRPNGFMNSICSKNGINGPTIYWGLLFVLSKFLELGDTVFIVLRKRPLVFLQWYHHLATLMVTWAVAPYVEPISRWYGFLNFFVHSLMYPYFALRTIGIRVPPMIANVITTCQLAQMIIGFSVNMLSLWYLRMGYDCVRYPISIKAFNIVYGSFIILFGRLFYLSVIKCERQKKEKLKQL